ncbi:hypothetical protein ACWGPW_24425 [Paenibacillus chitinolyticus]
MFNIEGDKKFVEWYENATEEERQHNSVWKFSLAMILLAGIIFIGVRNQEQAPTAYEVTGVHGGSLQVVERATGARAELRDSSLVKRALNGDIKRGDVIRY